MSLQHFFNIENKLLMIIFQRNKSCFSRLNTLPIENSKFSISFFELNNSSNFPNQVCKLTPINIESLDLISNPFLDLLYNSILLQVFSSMKICCLEHSLCTNKVWNVSKGIVFFAALKLPLSQKLCLSLLML